MSDEIIRYGFVAGEISKKLYGRTDLEKYDLGVAMAKNYFVDYTGGLSTRPGTEFCDVLAGTEKKRLFPFKFAPNVDQTYLVVVGDQTIRFMQDGAYILEPGKTITGVAGAVITAAAHGFSVGDLVKLFDLVGLDGLNGGTFRVTAVTTNTLTVEWLFGGALDASDFGAYASGGTVLRIYTVTSPWPSSALEGLKCYQTRSVLTFTHEDYPVQQLTRVSDTNWTIGEPDFGTAVAAPTGVTVTPSEAGTAGVAFAVVAVDAEGNESLPSAYGFSTACVDYANTRGSVKVTWTPVAGAIRYRVFRSIITPAGADISRAAQVGYVGDAFGPEFVDDNIVPDFTKTPRSHLDPFANGSITYIRVTAGGSGYTNSATVTVTSGTGSGFVGFPVVTGGKIVGVVVLNGGAGYTTANAVSFTGGTGATAVIDSVSDPSGNNPRVSTVFQQRRVYAATSNKPLSLFGSVPKQFENFDVSSVVNDGDAYTFELDSEEVSPIRHLHPTRNGLVAFTKSGLWQLQPQTGQAVTPSNAIAVPETDLGASDLRPLAIDTSILYQEGKGARVRLINFVTYLGSYQGLDLSILARHLVTPSNNLVRWDWASDPYKLVYGVRKDGKVMLLTILPEQNVYAWTWMQTKGLVEDVCVLQEGNTDSVYLLVRRHIDGEWVHYVERVASRVFGSVEDAWCVDSGLELTLTAPAADLTPGAITGSGVTFTASANVFAAGDVGKVLRGGGGKAIVTAYVSPTQVTADIVRDITAVLPESANEPLLIEEGDWTLDAPVTTIKGLFHLRGQQVSILADGNVVTPQTVSATGTVTLSRAASNVRIGLGYEALMQTLPPTQNGAIIEAAKKRVTGLAVRLDESRGLEYGYSTSLMWEMAERTDEPMGEPTRLQSGVRVLDFPGEFDQEAQVYFRQVNPLPITLLGYVISMVVGDDNRANQER